MKKYVAFIAFLACACSSLWAEAKNALLIANCKYQYCSPLETPVGEARDLKSSLEKVGFNVTLVENAGLDAMYDAIAMFGEKTKADGGIGFFHYGGHAVQVNGYNYLIPIDADIPDEMRIKSRTIDVDDLMASLNADTNIVVLDSCRNNPLKSNKRGASRGLSFSDVKPANSIIVYSAEAGMTAQDGVFTPSLSKHITEQKSLTEILREVRSDVLKQTDNNQSPGSYDRLINEVYLLGKPEVSIATSSSKTKDASPAAASQKKSAGAKAAAAIKLTGSAKDAFSKGMDYYDKKEYENAFECLMVSAKAGHAKSQNFVADMLRSGKGCQQDLAKALSWYEKAAEQGYTNAQVNTGIMYEEGMGCKKNYKKAVEMYTLASTGGNAVAMYYLGLMYYDGHGVERSYDTAAAWFYKAYENGSKDAGAKIEYMKKHQLIEK